MATHSITQQNVTAQHASGTTFVYVAAIFAALGGLLFGYDTGVISGAEIFIKDVFKLSAFAQGVIVSGVLIGAVAGALSGGRLADRFGRRRLLLVTSIIFIIGAIICAEAMSPAVLIGGRIVVGIAIGLSSTTVPVYISEVSPARARGWMVSLFQLAITVGILGAYVVDYGFAASGSWRWMLGLAVVPAVIFGLGMLVLPESPRWLAQHGHLDTARDVLARIRGGDDAQTEMNEIEANLKQQKQSGTWAELLTANVRPALIVGIGLAIFQQVTGINTVIYYAPTIIQSAGIPSASGAILATAGIGVVNVMMTIVSMRLIDRKGRRPLLLTGIAGMAVTLTVLGLAFRLSINGGALAWVAVICLMAYVASFAISLGPIFWLLISEIYPLKIRGLAQGTAATFNWGSNLVVSLLFLPLLELLGPSWTYWLYALLTIGAFLFAFFLVPETKERTLEEIERSLKRGGGLEGQRA